MNSFQFAVFFVLLWSQVGFASSSSVPQAQLSIGEPILVYLSSPELTKWQATRVVRFSKNSSAVEFLVPRSTHSHTWSELWVAPVSSVVRVDREARSSLGASVLCLNQDSAGLQKGRDVRVDEVFANSMALVSAGDFFGLRFLIFQVPVVLPVAHLSPCETANSAGASGWFGEGGE